MLRKDFTKQCKRRVENFAYKRQKRGGEKRGVGSRGRGECWEANKQAVNP